MVDIIVEGTVTGCTFFNIKKDIWNQLKIDTTLILKRDPTNTFDKNAIQVHYQGKQIGWIDKDAALAIATSTDPMSHIWAEITRIFGNPDDRPHIEIMVKK